MTARTMRSISCCGKVFFFLKRKREEEDVDVEVRETVERRRVKKRESRKNSLISEIIPLTSAEGLWRAGTLASAAAASRL